MNVLAVTLGGALGSVARYAISLLTGSVAFPLFPWSTFLINILGCFCIGLLYQIAEQKKISPSVRLGLGTGLLGGFTTFSTFSFELLNLIKIGHFLLAILYSVATLAVGLAACLAGIDLVRKRVTAGQGTGGAL